MTTQLSHRERQIKERERLMEQTLGVYMKNGEYREQFEELHRFPIKKVRQAMGHSIDQWDYLALGQQFERQEAYHRFAENLGTLSQLGQLPLVYLSTLTAVYGSSPLLAFASQQPIKSEQGLVYYQDVVAQTDRGNVSKNDKLLSTLQIPDSFPNGYASSTVTAEQIVDDSNGQQTYGPIQLGQSKSFMNPIRVQTVSIYGSVTFAGGSDVLQLPKMAVDATTGKFSGGDIVNGTLYTCAGTFDFDAGQVTLLKFNADPTGQTNIFVDYEVLLEATSDLPSIQLEMTQKLVKARLFGLKSTMGIPQAFQLEQQFGISGADMMAKNLTTAMINEQFNVALALLVANIPASIQSSHPMWKRVPPQSGVSTYEHKMTLEDAMADASELLLTTAGRGSVNVWIAGRTACTIMSTIPGFTKLYRDNNLGPSIYGTFGGAVVIRVPYTNLLPATKIVGVCKGDNPFDAPLVISPYMPAVMTGLLPNGYNPLMQQRGMATWTGIDILVANFLTMLEIDLTGFSNSY